MFDDLDKTLRALLTVPEAPELVREADISFVTPTKDFAPSVSTLNLFLHDVSENASLQAHRPSRTLETERVIDSAGPLWVDCGYLATAWSSMRGEERTFDEHRLLGEAMVWLATKPELDPEVAVGALAGSPHHMAVEVARTAEGERLGQFWTALGIAPRPAFSVKVTVALKLPVADIVLPRLKAVNVRSTSADAPGLSGRLLDAESLKPLAGQVAIEGAGAATEVGSDGHFTFPDVKPGALVLVAEVPGRPEQRLEITYSKRRQVHNILVPLDGA